MLKNKIKYSFLFLSFGIIFMTNAQQVYIESGFNTAFFKNYINNLGENTLDDSFSKPRTLFFEAGLKFNLYKDRMHFDVGSNYNNYKISTAFSSGNIKIPTTYDLSYIALKIGVNISIIKWKKLKVQLNLHASHDWLTAGTNSYNNTIVDLYKEKTLDRTLVRFYRGIALDYKISKTIGIYLKYSIGNSIEEQNKDSQNGESYSLETKSLSLGLLFNINKK